ncbi:MAG: histidine phosphatase family protein [Varibaculum sp.]|nr:histidine phosphatase family protein [Varibaculum sp.]
MNNNATGFEREPITTIHLMRHGEVDNPDGILYGRLPGYRLSELGEQMAEQVARYFEERTAEAGPITAVITSPLLRAQQSGAPTAAAFGLEATTDERLIESGNSFEGMPVNRNPLALAKPKYWWRYRNPLRPSWGESYSDQALRMVAAVRDILHANPGGEVLVVSHQLPIWLLRRWLERRVLWHDPRRRECSLASLTTLRFEGETLISLSYREPAGGLLGEARDMVPGTSGAEIN